MGALPASAFARVTPVTDTPQPSAAAGGAAERDVACILGLPIDVIDLAGAVARVRDAARTRTPLFLSTPNLNFAITALGDAAFRDSVIDSDLAIADGMPLVWVARLLGVDLPGRVSGAGLLEALRSGPRDDPVKVYFFGGEEGAAEAAARRLDAEPCGLRCVGWESPGFGSAETLSRPESIARINASGADFLVVSLGAKKGQAWIQRNRAQLRVPVVSHLGAALNFLAGTVKRAPPALQRRGLEWLWRIKEEPALWRRYAGDGWVFARVVTTRMLPLAWTLRTARDAGQVDRALSVDSSGAGVRVRFQGEQDVVPDMRALGNLMLLHGRARRSAQALHIDGMSERVRRVLENACAAFVMTSPREALPDAPVPSDVARSRR